MKNVGASPALIFKEELCLVQIKADHLHSGIMKDEDFYGLIFHFMFLV